MLSGKRKCIKDPSSSSPSNSDIVHLGWGNNGSLKLRDQVLERVAENFFIREDDIQFGFKPGCSTTDAICIVRQLQEKFYGIHKTLCMAFVSLKKGFL